MMLVRAETERLPLQGDEAELYAELADDLVNVIRRLVTVDYALIEDACQYAWVQMLRLQPRRDTLRSWLITVAKRRAIDLARAARRIEPMSIGEHTAGEFPEPVAHVDQIEQALDLDQALHVLAQLPDRKARLFALKALGFSYDEIGRMTGDSFSTINRQLSRTYRLLEKLDIRRE